MDKQPDEQQPRMSRQQYREQQRQEQRQAVEEPAASVQNKEEPSPNFEQPQSREGTVDQRRQEALAEKTDRLKHRLNLAIIGLVIAIIIVYLILFYVG